MAKKKKSGDYPQTNLIPFKREDYIRQPRSVSRMEYRMDIIQLRAFACLMEKLEPFVIELLGIYNKNKDDKQLSLFDLPQARQYIDRDGMFMFSIPMKSLGISTGYYKRAKASLDELTTIPVSIPYRDEKGEERVKVGPAFYIDTKAEKDARYVKEFKIGMIRSVLDTMVDIRLGYNDHLKRIAFVSSNVNTVRLYVLTVSNTIRGKKSSFEISLEDFRDFLGLYTEVKGKKEPKYKRYADLEKRVLIPATEELKRLADNGNSDFWITIERIGIGEKGNPRSFLFRVYYTQLAENELCTKESRREDAELDSILKNLFQTPSNIRKIKSQLLPEQRVEFRKELERISDILKKRTDVENPRAFVWVLIKNWLENHALVAEEISSAKAEEPIQMEIFPLGDTPESTNSAEPQNNGGEQWEKFMNGIACKVGKTDFATWFSSLQFVSFEDSVLTVAVPTVFVFQYIEDNFIQQISSVLKEIYGKNTLMEYRVIKY